jgi:predicted  nucleic acid-binding Zn-ribbon protein
VQKLVHNCSSCGKTLIGKSVSGKCLKCSNHSFKNLPDQLVSSECVGDRVLSTSDPVADVSNCEIVPLKQFARAGKRGHYLSFGVCMIDAESAIPSLDVSKLSNNLTKD